MLRPRLLPLMVEPGLGLDGGYGAGRNGVYGDGLDCLGLEDEVLCGL